MCGWLIMVRPMDSRSNNFVYSANEWIVLLNSYFILLFSDFVPEPEQRYFFGKVYLGVLAVSMAFNIALFIFMLVI